MFPILYRKILNSQETRNLKKKKREKTNLYVRKGKRTYFLKKNFI